MKREFGLLMTGACLLQSTAASFWLYPWRPALSRRRRDNVRKDAKATACLFAEMLRLFIGKHYARRQAISARLALTRRTAPENAILHSPPVSISRTASSPPEENCSAATCRSHLHGRGSL